MGIVSETADEVEQKLADDMYSQLKSIIIYAFESKKYLTTLEEDTKQLQGQQERIRYLIGRAENNEEIILATVRDWERNSQIKKKAADNIHDHPTACCLSFLDPYCNCFCRCFDAKKADNLSKKIKILVTEGEKFNRDNVSVKAGYQKLSITLPDDYQDIPSRDAEIERLKKLLVSDEMVEIGVYGEEGVGKTTLVHKLAIDINDRFAPNGDENDDSSEFKGVVVISGELMKKKDDEGAVIYIQNLISERLGFDFSDLVTIEGKAGKVNERLSDNGSKVLIIIDDLRESSKLSDIGIPSPSAKNGCRIVQVFSQKIEGGGMKLKHMNLDVERLSQQESMNLFNALAKEYENASGILLAGQTRISSSKPTWSPREIRDVVKELAATEVTSVASNDQKPEKSIVTVDASSPVKTTIMGNASSPVKNNFMLEANLLEIVHVKNPQRWRKFPNPSTNSMVAELIEVWYLNIKGKAKEEWLKPETYYGAYFVYQLLPGAEGFATNKMELVVGNNVKSCYLDSSIAASLGRKGVLLENDVPREREDKWMEIEMGRFENKGLPNDEITFVVKNHNDDAKKTGLRVRGIELRPLALN